MACSLDASVDYFKMLKVVDDREVDLRKQSFKEIAVPNHVKTAPKDNSEIKSWSQN